MGSFITDDRPSPAGAVAIGDDGKPLQGWHPDPTKRHEERYFSQGVPTKLYRNVVDGKTVEGYDDVSPELKICPDESCNVEQVEQRNGETADIPSGDASDQAVDVQLCGRCRAELGAEDMGRSLGRSYDRCFKLHWVPVDMASGSMAVEMDIENDLRGPDGSLEDWLVFMLAEVAGELAIGSRVGADHIDLSFLAPGRVGPVRATVVPLHLGTRAGMAEVKVVDTGDNDQLMAVATVTARRNDG